MKKSLLIAMAVIVGLVSFAQHTTYQIPKVNPALAAKTVKTSKRAVSDKATQKATRSTSINNNVKVRKQTAPVSAFGTETKIGESTYDLQTNGSVANRCVFDPTTGKVQAVFTFSSEMNASWADRGTGYNFFDGTSWGPFPTSRIEGSTRTGWPELVTLANGTEVVISHAPADAALIMSTRDPLGSGTWNVSPLTSLSPSSILWPRVTVGGPDGNTIHLIAHNDQADPPINNVSGMIFYSRSLDGGQTWDIQSVQIPGFDNTNYAYISADGYAISANGNTVAIIYFGAIERTVLAKSTDNGTTWTSQTVFDIPFIYDPNSADLAGPIIGISDMNGDQTADTIFNSTDGAGALIVDADGVAHVFFGFMDYLDDTPGDGSWSYFPGVNGIGYWNDEMGDIEPQFVAGALDLDGSGVLLDNYPTIDIALYYSSLTTMPNAGIDANGCLYVTYSSIMEIYDQGSQFYRHIYGIKSCDNGCSWSFPIDLTPNDEFAECVYGSMGHAVGSDFHFVYQKDPEPGLNLQGDQDPVGLNEIMHVKESATRLDTVIGACVAGIRAQNKVFCSGDSVLITATCGTSWSWSDGSTGQSIYAKTFGLLSCDITTPCGVITDDVTLSAPSTAPTVIVSASATTACPGDSIVLTTNNVSNATWNWSSGDNTQSTVITTPAVYYVTVTNCGGQTLDSIEISLPTAPTATITGPSTVCPGDSIELVANTGSGLTYLWSTNETTSSIYVSSTGTIGVVVTNCTGSDSISVSITNTPAPSANITLLGVNDSICDGQSVGLNASGAGIGGNYLWSNGATSNTINVTISGSYVVTSYNACGDSAVSAATDITVVPLPPVPAITCFSAGSQWGFVCPQCISGSFQWTINGTSVGSNDTLLQDWQNVGSGTVLVSITNSFGCSSVSPNGNCFVGMEESSLNNSISIYPNPNDGHFAINFNHVASDKYVISVKNILGQMIYSGIVPVSGNFRWNINLTEFEAGVYFLTVANSEGEQTQKVIVK